MTITYDLIIDGMICVNITYISSRGHFGSRCSGQKVSDRYLFVPPSHSFVANLLVSDVLFLKHVTPVRFGSRDFLAECDNYCGDDCFDRIRALDLAERKRLPC